MVLGIAFAYVATGLVAATLMSWLVPLAANYRPSLGMRLLAVTAYTTLWPVIAVTAACYAVGITCQRLYNRRRRRHEFPNAEIEPADYLIETRRFGRAR